MTKKAATPSPYATIIQDLYEQEAMADHYESRERGITFNFPAEDHSMFAAIARRFGRSTAAFGGEVFAEHVRTLFISMSPADRRRLAVEADADHSAYLESKGYTSHDADGNPVAVGGNRWQRYADICDEVDAKEAK